MVTPNIGNTQCWQYPALATASDGRNPGYREQTVKPQTIEYSAQQIESMMTHLEVFAKYNHDYLISLGE